MTDLHAWITERVDEAERIARAADPVLAHVLSFVDYSDRQIIADERHVIRNNPGAALRRCEADRRILARHSVDSGCADDPMYATACDGCGNWGEYDYPNTENLNDCPELLDLAHAHGITEKQMAGLDRPQPPPRPVTLHKTFSEAFNAVIDATLSPPGNPTSSVPAALRGPQWKARP